MNSLLKCTLIAGGIFVAVCGLIIAVPEPFPHASGSSNGPCVTDWTKCADNRQLLEQHPGIRDACLQAANAEIQYGEPKWPLGALGSFYEGRSIR
jgi:hypothetical protein